MLDAWDAVKVFALGEQVMWDVHEQAQRHTTSRGTRPSFTALASNNPVHHWLERVRDIESASSQAATSYLHEPSPSRHLQVFALRPELSVDPFRPLSWIIDPPPGYQQSYKPLPT